MNKNKGREGRAKTEKIENKSDNFDRFLNQ